MTRADAEVHIVPRDLYLRIPIPSGEYHGHS
jgi:hypothetical protein